jgi:NAD(P)-dependent dehydrogenase (short-subunit alcohol dehydrogenase family)
MDGQERIIALTRHLPMEGHAFGVRANSISPGVIVTKQSREQLKDPAWGMLGRILLPLPTPRSRTLIATPRSEFSMLGIVNLTC